MHPAEWNIQLQTPEAQAYFETLYFERAEAQSARYAALLEGFEATFGVCKDLMFFSAPGRTELGGNHTDHQRGRVLAAAVTLDMVAAVAPRSDGAIRFFSCGMGTDLVDSNNLEPVASERGHSASLIRGVCAGLVKAGYRVGGFDAYQSSDIPRGSGLSSSAAFEVLVGTILSGLYNDGSIPMPEIARIGQYAENEYFGKPCGLMDQTASAVGGAVTIDFRDPAAPDIRQLPCPFEQQGYSLCVVNAGGSHADLTDEYAAIPNEMRAVAACFGARELADVDESIFFERVGTLRESVSDRALLRAIHFFFDNRCVLELAESLRAGDVAAYRQHMVASGNSSFACLQNIYPACDVKERSVALALALSERELRETGGWRVHGGGFAGTIQALVPRSQLPHYMEIMQQVFSTGCCFPLTVRPIGGEILRSFQAF